MRLRRGLPESGWQAVTVLTSALLWFAAAGGTLLLLVRLLAGVEGGWLWGSVPLAWIALWVWRRVGRRRPSATFGP